MKFISDKDWGALLLCPIWGVFHGYYWSLFSLSAPISLALTSFFLWIAVISEHTWFGTIFAVIGLLFVVVSFFSYGGPSWLINEVLSIFLHENIYLEISPLISPLVPYFIVGVTLVIYTELEGSKNNERKRCKRLVEIPRSKWNKISFVLFIPAVICLQKITLYLADLVSDLFHNIMGA
jgi:hypothetical protein